MDYFQQNEDQSGKDFSTDASEAGCPILREGWPLVFSWSEGWEKAIPVIH